MRGAASALGLDVVLVVVFAAIGRRSHAESGALADIASTAWPFLVGLVVGWAVAVASRRRVPRSVADGVPIWVGTIVIGMTLRHLTGLGTAPSFVLVASSALAILLLGWRAAASWRARRAVSLTA